MHCTSVWILINKSHLAPLDDTGVGGEPSQAEKQVLTQLGLGGETAGSDICFQQLVLSKAWKAPLRCSSCVKQMTGRVASCVGAPLLIGSIWTLPAGEWHHQPHLLMVHSKASSPSCSGSSVKLTPLTSLLPPPGDMNPNRLLCRWWHYQT